MTAQAIKKLVGDKVDDSDPKVIPAGRRHAGDRIASRANRKKRMRHDNETYSAATSSRAAGEQNLSPDDGNHI